jgi:hypothetical protein
MLHDLNTFQSRDIKQGDFFDFFMYSIQHCFICRPSDSNVSEDGMIEPRTVATSALAAYLGCAKSNGLLYFTR